MEFANFVKRTEIVIFLRKCKYFSSLRKGCVSNEESCRPYPAQLFLALGLFERLISGFQTIGRSVRIRTDCRLVLYPWYNPLFVFTYCEYIWNCFRLYFNLSFSIETNYRTKAKRVTCFQPGCIFLPRPCHREMNILYEIHYSKNIKQNKKVYRILEIRT